MSDLRPLSRSSIRITAVGLGCWQFSAGHGIAGALGPRLGEAERARLDGLSRLFR